MKALILSAGYGTRLYPLTKERPKALLPIKEKPIVEYILEKIPTWVEEVFILSNQRFYPQFKNWFKNYDSSLKKRVRIVHNGSTSHKNRLGAVRDIEFVIQREKIKDHLLVIGGDNLFSFSLEAFLRFAYRRIPHISIMVYKLKDRQRLKKFGVVDLDKRKRVIEFKEKPSLPHASLVSTCIYFFPKQSFFLIKKYLEKRGLPDSCGDYIGWLSQKVEVYGFTARGRWFDIGSIDEYSSVKHTF
ncbi:MAG: nucleotidyltransferase family protein [Candidatus Omnitrophota bacterium]|nr:MAG: nucleotidyltransferase family protein [Candidatus Omnitrophota bacterium]